MRQAKRARTTAGPGSDENVAAPGISVFDTSAFDTSAADDSAAELTAAMLPAADFAAMAALIADASRPVAPPTAVAAFTVRDVDWAAVNDAGVLREQLRRLTARLQAVTGGEQRVLHEAEAQTVPPVDPSFSMDAVVDKYLVNTGAAPPPPPPQQQQSRLQHQHSIPRVHQAVGAPAENYRPDDHPAHNAASAAVVGSSVRLYGGGAAYLPPHQQHAYSPLTTSASATADNSNLFQPPPTPQGFEPTLHYGGDELHAAAAAAAAQPQEQHTGHFYASGGKGAYAVSPYYAAAEDDQPPPPPPQQQLDGMQINHSSVDSGGPYAVAFPPIVDGDAARHPFSGGSISNDACAIGGLQSPPLSVGVLVTAEAAGNIE